MAVLGCNTWPGSSVQTLFTATDLPTITDYTPGMGYSIGLRVTTVVAGDIRAVRYLRSAQEASGSRSIGILDWKTGQEYVAAKTVSDAVCTSSGSAQWVSVPLTSALHTAVGTEYLIYVDSVTYFPRSDGYFAAPKTSGYLTATGSSSGPAGHVPWDDFWQNSNYFIDGE